MQRSQVCCSCLHQGMLDVTRTVCCDSRSMAVLFGGLRARSGPAVGCWVQFSARREPL